MAQRKLEKVAGVSSVVFKEKRQDRSLFEVQSRKGRFVRGDLARAVVESGWDLNELRPAAVSLEEIFLKLTVEPAAPVEEAAAKGAGK
jgi:ABC-2 type transport system ATP-binding protein